MKKAPAGEGRGSVHGVNQLAQRVELLALVERGAEETADIGG